MRINQPTFSQLKKYKCFFFDFDGVVLESSSIKTEAFPELYLGQGIETEVRNYHLANQGISRYIKFKWIAENLLHESYEESQGVELGKKFSNIVKNKVLEAPFVKGFKKLISRARDNGVYCVIASGTPETELREIVVERQLEDYFEEVHGSPKSKEQIVNDIIARKSFGVDECLFFGDASTDHQASMLTGVHFYARLTSELESYWSEVNYTFGSLDFSGIQE